METKKGTLEQSVLDVWRAEQPETEHGSGEHSYEVGTDRYAAYTELVTPGQIREFLEEMSDEDFDSLLEEADEEFLEGIITIMSEEDVILEKGLLGKVAGGVAKLAGKGIAKTAKGVAHGVKRYGTTAGRARGLEKKVAKVKQKKKDKASIDKSKKFLDSPDKKTTPGKTKKTAPAAAATDKTKPAASDKPATKKTTKPKKTAKPKLGPGGGEAKPKKRKKAFDEGEDSMTENTSLRETIINMWKEAASAAVDPNERDELDKEPDGRGGAETAKKMKRAAEPKPMIAAEEAELDETNKNDKSDDGEGLDAVQPKAVKKKFKDRIDKDIDNDGDTDDSDKFLHKRRKAVSKAIKKDEEVTWEQAQDFKVQSMREALRKVWNIDEGELPPALKKAIDAKKKDKEEEDEDHKPGHDKDDEKTLTGKKKSAVDINPSLQAQKY